MNHEEVTHALSRIHSALTFAVMSDQRMMGTKLFEVLETAEDEINKVRTEFMRFRRVDVISSDTPS